MTLEEMILDLTSRTPSGGTCRLGDAAFKVWYCSDIWEWEFLGETYFDAQDLAEAIAKAGGSGRVQVPPHSGKPVVAERTPWVMHAQGAASQGSVRLAG